MSGSGITGDLDELLALERRLDKATGPAIAILAAKRIGAVARAQYRAGTGPDGTPWEPKEDGSRALVNAASEVTFTASGSAIVGRAPLHYRFHRAKRPVFPPDAGPLPAAWERPLIEAAREVIEGKKT